MKTLISSLQWMAFMIAGSIAAPIAIADAFHFSAGETALFVQRTLFVLGIGGLLQGIFGHRMPINEGPAGLWWSVFAIYAGLVGSLYSSSTESLQYLAGALIVTGIFFFLLAFTGLVDQLNKLFTPVVTFIYLLLLVLQLSGSFMKGMLGITGAHQEVRPLVAVLSLVTVLLTFYFGHVKKPWVKQYSIMLGLICGWILFALFGEAPAITFGESWFSLPAVFDFGKPRFDSGAITTGVFIGLLLTANMITSVRVMGNVTGVRQERVRSSLFISGINQLLAGIFSAVGAVPIAAAAGYVAQTGIKVLKPFLYGACFVSIIALLPPLVHIMSAIPAPVGYAVTFVVFTQLVGLALNDLEKSPDKEIAHTTAGISFLVGIGAMFLPAHATEHLPMMIATFLNNGLILGSVVGILTEQLLIWRKKRNTQENSIREQ
ncbi:purine/pyrimidine permease [Heyndrickxia faecalis]|uniref:purine/pyrimidine permease n=1 Tax=Heyndrickxia faecalis TaxID=2824910 RepID=UPI003100E537